MNNLLAQNFQQIIGNTGSPGLATLQVGGIPYIFFVVVPYVIYGSALLLLIYLLTGGLQLMMSRGDPKGVAGAWAKITNALIGFIIVFLAYSLTSILGNVFGLNGFEGVINK